MTTNHAVGVQWDHLSRSDLDLQLSPSKFAKDAAGTLARHQRQTAALRDDPTIYSHHGVRYGDAPGQYVDLYRPRRTTSGKPKCLVFVHGGFWQEGSPDGAGFAAADLIKEGWALATIGYSLTPLVRVRDIVGEVATALLMLRDRLGVFGIDGEDLVVAGHSAGAHLVAAIIAGLDNAHAAVAIDSAILISGVYDLAPIAASYVNDLAGLDAEEIAELSPLFATPVRDVPVHLVIGADEPDAFQAQTTALYHAWKPHLTDLTVDRVEGRDHFDILDELAARV